VRAPAAGCVALIWKGGMQVGAGAAAASSRVYVGVLFGEGVPVSAWASSQPPRAYVTLKHFITLSPSPPCFPSLPCRAGTAR
jgi:hypothetical protein